MMRIRGLQVNVPRLTQIYKMHTKEKRMNLVRIIVAARIQAFTSQERYDWAYKISNEQG